MLLRLSIVASALLLMVTVDGASISSRDNGTADDDSHSRSSTLPLVVSVPSKVFRANKLSKPEVMGINFAKHKEMKLFTPPQATAPPLPSSTSTTTTTTTTTEHQETTTETPTTTTETTTTTTTTPSTTTEEVRTTTATTTTTETPSTTTTEIPSTTTTTTTTETPATTTTTTEAETTTTEIPTTSATEEPRIRIREDVATVRIIGDVDALTEEPSPSITTTTATTSAPESNPATSVFDMEAITSATNEQPTTTSSPPKKSSSAADEVVEKDYGLSLGNHPDDDLNGSELTSVVKETRPNGKKAPKDGGKVDATEEKLFASKPEDEFQVSSFDAAEERSDVDPMDEAAQASEVDYAVISPSGGDDSAVRRFEQEEEPLPVGDEQHTAPDVVTEPTADKKKKMATKTVMATTTQQSNKDSTTDLHDVMMSDVAEITAKIAKRKMMAESTEETPKMSKKDATPSTTVATSSSSFSTASDADKTDIKTSVTYSVAVLHPLGEFNSTETAPEATGVKLASDDEDRESVVFAEQTESPAFDVVPDRHEPSEDAFVVVLDAATTTPVSDATRKQAASTPITSGTSTVTAAGSTTSASVGDYDYEIVVSASPRAPSNSFYSKHFQSDKELPLAKDGGSKDLIPAESSQDIPAVLNFEERGGEEGVFHSGADDLGVDGPATSRPSAKAAPVFVTAPHQPADPHVNNDEGEYEYVYEYVDLNSTDIPEGALILDEEPHLITSPIVSGSTTSPPQPASPSVATTSRHQQSQDSATDPSSIQTFRPSLGINPVDLSIINQHDNSSSEPVEHVSGLDDSLTLPAERPSNPADFDHQPKSVSALDEVQPLHIREEPAEGIRFIPRPTGPASSDHSSIPLDEVRPLHERPGHIEGVHSTLDGDVAPPTALHPEQGPMPFMPGLPDSPVYFVGLQRERIPQITVEQPAQTTVAPLPLDPMKDTQAVHRPNAIVDDKHPKKWPADVQINTLYALSRALPLDDSLPFFEAENATVQLPPNLPDPFSDELLGETKPSAHHPQPSSFSPPATFQDHSTVTEPSQSTFHVSTTPLPEVHEVTEATTTEEPTTTTITTTTTTVAPTTTAEEVHTASTSDEDKIPAKVPSSRGPRPGGARRRSTTTTTTTPAPTTTAAAQATGTGTRRGQRPGRVGGRRKTTTTAAPTTGDDSVTTEHHADSDSNKVSNGGSNAEKPRFGGRGRSRLSGRTSRPSASSEEHPASTTSATTDAPKEEKDSNAVGSGPKRGFNGRRQFARTTTVSPNGGGNHGNATTNHEEKETTKAGPRATGGRRRVSPKTKQNGEERASATTPEPSEGHSAPPTEGSTRKAFFQPRGRGRLHPKNKSGHDESSSETSTSASHAEGDESSGEGSGDHPKEETEKHSSSSVDSDAATTPSSPASPDAAGSTPSATAGGAQEVTGPLRKFPPRFRHGTRPAGAGN